MAQHKVIFAVPERELGRADIEFKINRDGKSFGKLKISNGTVVWVQRDSTYGYKMEWVDFDKLMVENGKRENNK